MNKHTPGPWDARKGVVAWVIRPVDPDAKPGVLAATMGGNDVANARLIAAAPELLALVVDFERVAAMDFSPNRNDNLLDLASRARGAIAKTRGEP